MESLDFWGIPEFFSSYPWILLQESLKKLLFLEKLLKKFRKGTPEGISREITARIPESRGGISEGTSEIIPLEIIEAIPGGRLD